MTGGIDWKEEFDGAYSAMAIPIQERIWREVFGEDYPEGVVTYSYLSRSELLSCQRLLGLGHGDVFADIGCGPGGPGLSVAAGTGARLIGVDISSVAIEQATANAARLGLPGQAEFRLGSFEQHDLPERGLDAVLSVDALIFAPDKRTAISGVARALRPGGRFVATTIDYRSQPAGRPPQVDDHRPLLADAGFDVVSYTATDQWRHRMEAVTSKLLAATAEIAAATGEDPDQLHAEHLEMRETIQHILRRVLIVAARR
jgi:SAM-dependent methyltransferase